MSYDQRSKDYVGKRKRDGKSKKEAIRCLKRYIAREVFRALRNPLEIKGPSWKDLRPARQALGITLVEAGKALNVGFQKVSYAETGRLMNVQFLEEYDAWLKSQAKKASCIHRSFDFLSDGVRACQALVDRVDGDVLLLAVLLDGLALEVDGANGALAGLAQKGYRPVKYAAHERMQLVLVDALLLRSGAAIVRK